MTNAATLKKRARQRAFLDSLAITGVVKVACEAAGVSRKAAYEWRDADEAFAELWDDAIATAADGLEAEAHRRAVDGVEEVVMHRGQIVFRRDENGELVRDSAGQPIPMTAPRRSDRLLEVMLGARKPEAYGRRTLDVNQRVEQRPRVPPGAIDFRALSPQQRELVRRLLELPDGEPLPEIAPPTDDAF